MKTEYRTEDEGPTMLSAGKLTEDGVSFRLHFLREKPEGKYGTFWMVEGKTKDADGKESDFVMSLSSTKLKNILERIMKAENVSATHGVNVHISGRGTGYEREYSVTVEE